MTNDTPYGEGQGGALTAVPAGQQGQTGQTLVLLAAMFLLIYFGWKKGGRR